MSKGAPSFTWVVESIGYLGFTFMIPIMGAYIASSIADKPAFAPAFLVCYLANDKALLGTQSGAGFLGAVVLGLAMGNEESFCSCSHGAGRVMSRTKAKKLFSVEDQIRATAHVECRKDAEVIDEIPMAYKDIDAVMAAQSDLVEVIYTLRQVVCVKG